MTRVRHRQNWNHESGGDCGQARRESLTPSLPALSHEIHGLHQKYEGHTILGQDLKAARTLYIIHYLKAAAYSL